MGWLRGLPSPVLSNVALSFTRLRDVGPDVQALRVAAEVPGPTIVRSEDADLATQLAALGPGALADLRGILDGSATYRHDVLVALMARPTYADLATLIAMADTDEVVRLQLLRAIRDLGPRMD